MLAALDQLADGELQIAAIAPQRGPLAEEFAQRGIVQVPLILRDRHGRRLPRTAACENLLEAVRRCAPNLLHANSLSMGRLTGAVAAQLNLPTVAHLRDIIKLSRAAVDDLNSNTRLLAVSNAARTFHAGQGLDADRLRVVYNGVDCREFRPRPATGTLRRELGLPDGTVLVAAIGQIALRKGYDVLAEAAAMAAPRMPQAHFVIVGERLSSKQESIEFEHRVLRRFQRAGLARRLHGLGFRSDVPYIMNECHLLVHAARQEPFGRVLLEAAASGLPIVATRVGGTEEILANGVSAWLVPPDEPAELADAMTVLYAEGELRRRLAECAREEIERRFDIRRTASQLKRVWREQL